MEEMGFRVAASPSPPAMGDAEEEETQVVGASRRGRRKGCRCAKAIRERLRSAWAFEHEGFGHSVTI